jgi:hypothetical protein
MALVYCSSKLLLLLPLVLPLLPLLLLLILFVDVLWLLAL